MAKTNATWTQKVLARLNLSEEGKIGLYEDTLVKEWKKAIRDAKREIKSLQIAHDDMIADKMEQVEDMKEAHENLFVEVDVTRINTSTDRKEYTRDFTRTILESEVKIEEFLNDVEYLNTVHDKKIAVLQKKIDVTEKLLAKIKGKE